MIDSVPMPAVGLDEEGLAMQTYVRQLLTGEASDTDNYPETVGKWSGIAEHLAVAYQEGYARNGQEGATGLVESAYAILCKKDKGFKRLMDMAAAPQEKEVRKRTIDPTPPLPVEARLDYTRGAKRRQCVDEFIKWSTYWSPRGHFIMHESMYLWILSTLAARRIRLPIATGKYTSLYVVFAADTGRFAKTTTMENAREVLRVLNLKWMLLSPNTTPEMFYQDAAGHVPDNYDDLSPEKQFIALRDLRFAAQKSIIFEEFGTRLNQLQQQASHMSKYLQIYLSWADCPSHDAYRTVGRGTDYIEDPYLSILASMTIDNVQRLSSAVSLAHNGFLARWALISPDPAEYTQEDRPEGIMTVPESILETLRAFYEQLPEPEVEEPQQLYRHDKPTGIYEVIRAPHPYRECIFEPAVYPAYKRYNRALNTMVIESAHVPKDLHGNYMRLAEMGLKIAALLAFVDNDGRVTLEHWIAAQEITERWRASAHQFHREVNATQETIGSQVEAKILKYITAHYPEGLKASDIQARVGGVTSKQLADYLLAMETVTGTIASYQRQGERKMLTMYTTPQSPCLRTSEQGK